MRSSEEQEQAGAAGEERKYDHHRMRVYEAAIEFLRWRRGALRRLPPTHPISNQLTRAATSITLNIAEACGEFSGPARAHFFRLARRSATECDAILESAAALGLDSEARMAEGRTLLRPIVAMLTPLSHPR